jgi:hypothetical protein
VADGAVCDLGNGSRQPQPLLEELVAVWGMHTPTPATLPAASRGVSGGGAPAPPRLQRHSGRPLLLQLVLQGHQQLARWGLPATTTTTTTTRRLRPISARPLPLTELGAPPHPTATALRQQHG